MPLMRTPKSMDLEITSRCNLRCEYCSHFTSAGDVGVDLPKEEWLRFFEELNLCAVLGDTLNLGMGVKCTAGSYAVGNCNPTGHSATNNCNTGYIPTSLCKTGVWK